jgi:hypothetical protein
MEEAVGELLQEALGFQCAKVLTHKHSLIVSTYVARRTLTSWFLEEQARVHHCLQIDAAKVPDLSAHLKVTSVPTTLFLSKGNVVDRVEGFQPGILFEKADAHKPVPLQERLKQLTTSQPVMLFMKGTPEAPRCGFSKRVVAALQQDGIPFGHFDILTDEEVHSTVLVLAVTVHCSARTTPPHTFCVYAYLRLYFIEVLTRMMASQTATLDRRASHFVGEARPEGIFRVAYIPAALCWR